MTAGPFTTMTDPYDLSPRPTLRTWATIAEARAYSLAMLDRCPGLVAVAIGTADGADVAEFVRR